MQTFSKSENKCQFSSLKCSTFSQLHEFKQIHTFGRMWVFVCENVGKVKWTFSNLLMHAGRHPHKLKCIHTFYLHKQQTNYQEVNICHVASLLLLSRQSWPLKYMKVLGVKLSDLLTGLFLCSTRQIAKLHHGRTFKLSLYATANAFILAQFLINHKRVKAGLLIKYAAQFH